MTTHKKETAKNTTVKAEGTQKPEKKLGLPTHTGTRAGYLGYYGPGPYGWYPHP